MVGRGEIERRLRTASWLINPDTQTIFALLDGETGRTRAVGGIVRDTLLGIDRPGGEVDFATELHPDEVLARAARRGIAAYPTGIAHGTVTLHQNGLVAEVTTLREDVETDGRHAVVRFGTDWKRDAERRDFTINALYADRGGVLYDPLGGAADLADPTIRFIGDADQRIAEDRLRVFRFFRFSASHGGERFDPAGLAAVKRAAGTLEALSAERVGGEMRRMLGLPRIAATLRAMKDAGVLAFDDEVLAQLRRYGLGARRPNFFARLAVLVASGETGVQAAWRLSNDDMTRAQAIIAAARLLEDLQVHEAAYRYPQALDDGVDVAAVLAGWTEAGKSAVVDQLAQVRVKPFPISGSDLLAYGFAPGPALGSELSRLERLWIASGFALDRLALLAAIAPAAIGP